MSEPDCLLVPARVLVDILRDLEVDFPFLDTQHESLAIAIAAWARDQINQYEKAMAEAASPSTKG